MNLPLVLAASAALLGVTSLAAAAQPPEKFWVFVGTYTRTASKGIYRFELDAATGKVGNLELAGDAGDPSFLAIPPGGKFLYSIGNVEAGGKKGGGVIAFALDPASGRLTKLNAQSLGDKGT